MPCHNTRRSPAPENWEIDLLLREREFEQAAKRKTPSKAFLRGLGIGILASCGIWALLYWKFYL